MSRFYTLEHYQLETAYYRQPKDFILKSSKYYNMTIQAKYLYGILYDRHSLSVSNGWYDEQGRVYFYYKQEELCEAMNMKDPKNIRKYLKELENNNLLTRVKKGHKKADIFYLMLLDSTKMSISENQYNGTGSNAPTKNSENKIGGQMPLPKPTLTGSNAPTNNNYLYNNNNLSCVSTESTTENEDYKEVEQYVLKNYKGKKTIKVRKTKVPKLLKTYSKQQLIKAIDNYMAECKKEGKFTEDNKRFIAIEGTFWNTKVYDYINAEEIKPKEILHTELDLNYKDDGFDMF